MKTLILTIALSAIALFAPATAEARDRDHRDRGSKFSVKDYVRYQVYKKYSNQRYYYNDCYEDRHHSGARPRYDSHGHRVDSHGHHVDRHGHHTDGYYYRR